MLTNQNKALQTQLSEMKRKQTESDCKVRKKKPSFQQQRCQQHRHCFSFFFFLFLSLNPHLRPSLLSSHPQSKEEVMAVRLREADSMAAVAELRQKIAELEIQVCYCAILLSFNIFFLRK